MSGTGTLTLRVLPDALAIVRLDPSAMVGWAPSGGFSSLTRTAHEISLVCAEAEVPRHAKAEHGFRALEVAGPLDFALTGILAAIAAPLAEAKVPIFAISTFDTDYVLVRDADLPRAIDALGAAGIPVAQG